MNSYNSCNISLISTTNVWILAGSIIFHFLNKKVTHNVWTKFGTSDHSAEYRQFLSKNAGYKWYCQMRRHLTRWVHIRPLQLLLKTLSFDGLYNVIKIKMFSVYFLLFPYHKIFWFFGISLSQLGKNKNRRKSNLLP